MKRHYWLIPVAIIGGIVMFLRYWDSPQPRQAHAREDSGTATSRLGVKMMDAVNEAAWTGLHWTAHTPLGKDRRPMAGEATRVGEATSTHMVPAVFTAFDKWLQGHLVTSASERTTRLAEGRVLLAARQALWPELARLNPEAALMLTPSPMAREALPQDMAAQLEQIVSGEGFYGVKAICNHEPTADHAAGCQIEHEVFIGGRSYQASIYGSRRQRLTEESASIYGVALGGLLALHEDDVVILPAAAVQPRGAVEELALIHLGKTILVPENQLAVRIQSLLNP